MKLPIWDLPVRLFHWVLVGLIAFAWWSAEYHYDDLHIWSGIAVLTLLIFRILWGFFGSSTARFANFVRGPRAVFGYLRGDWRGVGHNPLGALSVVALLGLVSLQVGLGLFASDEDGLM
ncbi:MAG TPA: cytochrome b/b6 domain-containing protein, partial [Sphingomicrobium sp.]